MVSYTRNRSIPPSSLYIFQITLINLNFMYSPLCAPFQCLDRSRIFFDGIIPLFHVFTCYLVHPAVFWECLVQVGYSVWVGGIEVFLES